MKKIAYHAAPHHTEAWWDMYALVDWVTIGSGNGLSPVQRQAITWINDDLM